MIYTWFAILFTTRFPKVAFDAYVGLLRWSHRLTASFMNLVDGYPPFGPGERWNNADIDVTYPENFHLFVVGTLCLQLCIGLYSPFLYFKYPEFNGEETKMDLRHLK